MKKSLGLAPNPTSEDDKHFKTHFANADGFSDTRLARAFLLMMNQYATIGGAAAHFGGPSAMLEIYDTLLSRFFKKSPWYEHYNFVNDIGHAENGLYVLRALRGFDGLKLSDLWKFRSIESKLTGHGEKHLNKGQVLISNGPLGSGLGAAQGLAQADHIQGINKRITYCTLSDGAFMEGEVKECLSTISGLRAKQQIAPFILILSDNDTKLSGRISDQSFSQNPSIASLETLGWHVIQVDLETTYDQKRMNQVLEKAEEKALSLEKPIFLWCKTIKGKGLKACEEASSGGHGHPFKGQDSVDEKGKFYQALLELYSGEKLPALLEDEWKMLQSFQASYKKTPSHAELLFSHEQKLVKIQEGLAQGLIDAKNKGAMLYSLSSDLAGSTGVAAFQKAFPHASCDLGIQESNMVSAACGLSQAGLIPVVDTFAAFGVTKGQLPLIMASLSEASMICVYSHTGLQDAADGASHQSLNYMASLSAIPHVKCINLSHSQQAHDLVLEASLDIQKRYETGAEHCIYVFFLGRETFPEKLNQKKPYQLNDQGPICHQEGEDLTVIATGPMLYNAMALAKELREKEKIHLQVLEAYHVNSFDVKAYDEALSKTHRRCLVIEDHQVIGGFSQMLSHQLMISYPEHHYKWSVAAHQGQFGRSAYVSEELHTLYGLGLDQLISRAKSLLSKSS